MGKLDEIKDAMELDRIMILMQLRKAELEAEIEEIKESLGEKLDDAKEEIHGFVNKIKANIKPILIGIALFAMGVFTGSLSSIL